MNSERACKRKWEVQLIESEKSRTFCEARDAGLEDLLCRAVIRSSGLMRGVVCFEPVGWYRGLFFGLIADCWSEFSRCHVVSCFADVG